MAQKRPPLPIFNKNKRPRQALVAHPNNSVRQRDSYTSNSERPFHSQPAVALGHPRLPGKSNSSHYAACGQENRISSSSQYHHGIKDNYHQPSRQRAPSHGGFGAGSSSNYLSKQQGQSVRQPPSSTQSTGQRPGPAMLQASVRQPSSTLHTKPQMSGAPVTGIASCSVGAAKEPTRDMGAQHKSASLSSTRKPTLRMLTATAQGMRHWSIYKQHCPLLFEVFGRLSSPTTLVRGQTKCKQFQLTTIDGPVNCIFWEMSSRLPRLVQGRPLRVVGQWNEKDEVMQSYAVREALKGEEMAAGKAIEASDRSMRQFVAELNQTKQ